MGGNLERIFTIFISSISFLWNASFSWNVPYGMYPSHEMYPAYGMHADNGKFEDENVKASQVTIKSTKFTSLEITKYISTQHTMYNIVCDTFCVN